MGKNAAYPRATELTSAHRRMKHLDKIALSRAAPVRTNRTASDRTPAPILRWSIWALGAALPFLGLFLPWISITVGKRRVLTVSGLDLALEDNWVTGAGVTLVSTHWVYLVAGVTAALSGLGLIIAGIRRRIPRSGQSTALMVFGTLAFGVIVARLKNAHDIAEDAGVSLESRVGLQLSLIGMVFLVAAGFLAYRTRTLHEEEARRRFTIGGFVGPAILLVLVFFFAPVLVLFLLSLTDLRGSNFSQPWTFIGFNNYVTVYEDPFRNRILGNTFRYVTLTLAFNVVMGLVIAILTSFVHKTAGVAVRALWLLPRITPPVVYIVIWTRIGAQAPYGIVNQLASVFGASPQTGWVNEYPWVFVILVNGFVGASLAMLILSSAIESIPRSHFMAAEVDGAGKWRLTRDIILPQLKWPLLFVTSYQTLSLLVSFEYILLLTGGGPGLFETEVWALTSYNRAIGSYFGANLWAQGAAWGVVLVALGTILSFIYLRVFRFRELVHEPPIEIV